MSCVLEFNNSRTQIHLASIAEVRALAVLTDARILKELVTLKFNMVIGIFSCQTAIAPPIYLH